MRKELITAVKPNTAPPDATWLNLDSIEVMENSDRAGNVSKSARINRQRLAQHKLHREVCDRPERRIGMSLLEPSPRLPRSLFVAMKVSQQCLEIWVGGNAL
jgi:hypothetical protein